VSDSTTSAIDKVFDLVDNILDKTDRALNRTKYTEEQHRARRAKRSPAMIDTAGSVKVTKKAPSSPASSGSTALAIQKKFHIIESIDAESGQTLFVVTNGTPSARAECGTRALAEKILRALENAP
jgi:hypothetical protein